MNNTYLKHKLVLLLFCGLMILSCKSREDKIRSVAYKLTSSSAFTNDPNIKSLTAGIVGDSQLNIRITLNMSSDPITGEIFESILPQMGKMLLQDRDLKELVDEGANIRIILQDKTEKEMVSRIFNKQSLASIDNFDISDNYDDRKTGNSNELNTILSVMNKALPIKDEASGTEIYKVTVSNQKELVYWVKVDQTLETLLKQKIMQEMMREELRSETELLNVYTTMRKYGIYKIMYKYVNAQEEELTSIVLKATDIKR